MTSSWTPTSIHIGFLDFQLFKDRPIFYDTCKLMSVHDHHLYTDLLSIGYVDFTSIHLATEEDKLYILKKNPKNEQNSILSYDHCNMESGL